MVYYYNLYNYFLNMVTMILMSTSFKPLKQFTFMLSENAINSFRNSLRFVKKKILRRL